MSQPRCRTVLAGPTLEELFGNLDYCSCDDCRSILEPGRLPGRPARLHRPARPAAGYQNPQDVLLGRRPDIADLPLTCENTNIALPYIDLVNETLEYYVANKLSLADYHGHNTDGTPDLRGAHRRARSSTTTPPPSRLRDAEGGLVPAAAAVRPAAGAAPPATCPASGSASRRDGRAAHHRQPRAPGPGGHYGWRDILRSGSACPRPEYRLLTDSTLTLADLYGYPAPPTRRSSPSCPGLQEFSRRAGVSYADLVAILADHVHQPRQPLIPLLDALAVAVRDAARP